MATHRKQVKHYHEPGDLHELTFSCYRRMPMLTNDPWRKHLADGIDAGCHWRVASAFVNHSLQVH